MKNLLGFAFIEKYLNSCLSVETHSTYFQYCRNSTDSLQVSVA